MFHDRIGNYFCALRQGKMWMSLWPSSSLSSWSWSFILEWNITFVHLLIGFFRSTLYCSITSYVSLYELHMHTRTHRLPFFSFLVCCSAFVTPRFASTHHRCRQSRIRVCVCVCVFVCLYVHHFTASCRSEDNLSNAYKHRAKYI